MPAWLRVAILKFSRWRALSAGERAMALEAMLFLLWADALIHLVPVRHWRSALERREDHPAPALVLRNTKRAVERAARCSPAPSRCLAQALAAAWMLRRRGVGGTIHVGAVRGGTGQPAFHAMLVVGPYTVTGAVDAAAFTALRPATRSTSRP